MELWLIVDDVDLFLVKSPSEGVPPTDFVSNQLRNVARALFLAVAFGLSATVADKLEDRLRVERKGDKLVGQVFCT